MQKQQGKQKDFLPFNKKSRILRPNKHKRSLFAKIRNIIENVLEKQLQSNEETKRKGKFAYNGLEK